MLGLHSFLFVIVITSIGFSVSKFLLKLDDATSLFAGFALTYLWCYCIRLFRDYVTMPPPVVPPPEMRRPPGFPGGL